MPTNKSKSNEKRANPCKANQNKYVLLRDTHTSIQLIVDYNSISNSKNAKIEVGVEVMYIKTNQSQDHGIVLMIGWFLCCNKMMILLLIMIE